MFGSLDAECDAKASTQPPELRHRLELGTALVGRRALETNECIHVELDPAASDKPLRIAPGEMFMSIGKHAENLSQAILAGRF